jgi:hypothetical protein
MSLDLTTQADVDSFQLNHGPCDQVDSLAVTGPDINNLDGLSGLTKVDGELWIQGNNALTSLGGLSALTSVGIRLTIAYNAALTSLNGLSALSSVGELLWINDNNNLTTLDGLSALTNIDGDAFIQRNAALTNVDGLSALTRVGNVLNFGTNAALSNVDGLSTLQEVGWLALTGNPNLDDCRGLATLIDPIDDYVPGPGSSDSAYPDIKYEYGVSLGQNLHGCNSVSQILAKVPLLEMNAGLNDAWFSPETDGQGFFFIVFPESKQMFMAWFTYDTERPPEDVTAILGEPGHRWLTAQGGYQGNVATLDVYVTSGGIFDSPQPAAFAEQDGQVTVEFNTCNSATVSYAIPSIDRQDVVPIERIVLDNVSLCYLLDNQPVPDETSKRY